MLEQLGLLLVILIVFYVFFFRSFLFVKRKFKCQRCGRCCSLKVCLSKEDIERLEKAGEKGFIEGTNYLKMINGYCKFLTLKNGKASCSVYRSRPDICKNYPIHKGELLPNSFDLRCKSADKLY